ncbi:TetR/AcrR family transcriptional regulator [Nonomuraea angiospora]|uniref:AcrR family transcriptional regulator n=1 Tax=Nonomuraea angiospora TaxID=46172 RepID=A0ABR9LXY8_9ACTN|nr:TetR/AcrR family transcriptional regulator [Nonomuraea angiospora]MBE1585511.1 AcrR family transcriptional regulator [Nonomuraea angiospora]
MGDQTTMSRRERLRAETTAEIKEIALKLMAAGGPDAISLRAIARDMGMTAGAIYSYFATRDDLVSTLIADLYTALVDRAESARDTVPAADPGGRVLAWAQTVREWALANPQGFRLIYGDPVPGYQPPEDGPAKEAEHRACRGLTGLVAAAWTGPDPGAYSWSDFDPGLAADIQARFPGLPPDAVALTLRVWGRMHGLVALEIYGHLRTLTRDPAAIYRDEMIALIESLGLTPPA